MPATIPVTSHSAGVLSPSYFDQLSVTPGSPPALPPPASVTTTPPAVPSGISSYPISTAYNDASLPTSLTYSDNEVASYGYDASSAWLSSLSTTPAGGSATTLLGGLGYSGAGGAAGHATSASVGGGTYSFSAAYDANTRLTNLSLTTVSSGSLVFRSQRGYDAASNVTAVNTTLSAGTDNQVFCYDEQNRLTWAGASGTPSCGTTLTPGTLSSASYTQPYAYDTLDRLTSGPLGSYTYGDSAHLHAATSIGTAYTASYDAVGNMTCRAADGTTTCSGTPTGAQLSYDNEGRLSHWQNAQTSPTTTDDFLYDGAGNRVEQLATMSGSPVTTIYVAGGLEEVTTSGITTTLTKYFSAPGLPTIERVGTNGPLSYLASDGQGSVSETLDGGGTVTFQQLYTPYGTSRYNNGSSPTTLGYTGQRADASTGLDYYQARYYDPAAGQFTSADTANDGLNRYGYAAGNPTTNTDPTGHMVVASDDYDGVYQPPIMGPVDCHTNNTCPPPPPSKTPTATPTATPKPTPLTGGDGSTPTSCGGLVCGLKDPGQFAAGLGLVIGGIGVFAAALAGLIWSFSNPFAKFAISLATSAVEKGAGVLAQIISQGLQMVLNAFVQVNPWLRVIVDIFSVLTDIAAMALSFLAGLSAVLERGRATMTLVEKWSFVVKGILNHESSTSVFALAKDALAESALGIFSGFGSFLADVFRLRDDLNVAMSSS